MTFCPSRTISRIALTALSGVAIACLYSTSVSAISGSDWRPGRIIDDTIFTNSNSMTAQQIQEFIDSKSTPCDSTGTKTVYDSQYGDTVTRAVYGQRRNNPAPFTCLANYYENPDTKANNYGGKPTPIGARSAAQLILEAAQAYDISPKTLLVTLQKEQGLLTDDWPLLRQYQYAMGAYCPDSGVNGSANCDSNYASFGIQMRESARLLRYYLDNMDQPWWTYKRPGNSTILFNAQASCGSSTVSISNKATAALYTYTPYQPNSAALANLYGTGDSCSAYGNRNFWRMYSNWFGTPVTSAAVHITQYDATTDNTGKAAMLGFSLSQRPQTNVTVGITLSPGAPATLSTKRLLTITPQTWNRPDLNKVVVVGLGSGQPGGTYYKLITEGIDTSDPEFQKLTPGYIPDVSLLQLNTSSTTVYRLYSPATQQHLYTTSKAERDIQLTAGMTNEGTAFSYCSSGERTLYRIAKGDKTLITDSGTSELQSLLSSGWVVDTALIPTSRGASIAVYRMYNPTNGDHLFTTNLDEYANANGAGYLQEGSPFKVCAPAQKPVYRLYNPVSGDHFYTASSQERDSAGGSGYSHEGVGFYLCADNKNDVTVYRLFNSKSGDHFYTASLDERSRAVQNKYRSEGSAFSVCSDGEHPIYRLFSTITGDHFYTPNISEATPARRSGYEVEPPGFYTSP